MADQSRHHISPIEFLTSSAQEALNVEVFVNQIIDLHIRVAIGLKPGMQALDLIVQKVANFLQYGHRIGLFFGVLSDFYQFVKQLIHVGQVKITGQDKVAGNPVVLAQKRVTSFDRIIAVGTIAQMSQQQLPHVRFV